MVGTAIKLIKYWRRKGLPFRVAFKNLFLAKIVPRFTYAYALMNLDEGGVAYGLIQKTIDKALCCTFGWNVPKRFKLRSGIWPVICGFPTVSALLRKLKLDMGARLKVADNRAGRIFRCLYSEDKGSFEDGVYLALKEWLLLGLWESLNSDTIANFKRKVSRVSMKCWPKNLPMNGNLTWLHHNHRAYSGNVPMWADWEWPKGKDVFRNHFHCLLIGKHPAGGNDARCFRILCRGKKRTSYTTIITLIVLILVVIEVFSRMG